MNPVFTLETAYDPAGNVVRLERTAGGVSQERRFDYDNRGFLTSEWLPEVGAAGQAPGRVRYTRDALGNPRSRFDGQHWLIFGYDGAGRKTEVTDGARTLQSWSWGTDNAGLDLRKGRIVAAARYNYPTAQPWIFTETYRYAGALARIDRKTLQLTYPDAGGTPIDGATFVQEYVFDRLGRRTSVTYPSCAGSGFCNDPGDYQGPVHTVSYHHSYDQMMAATSSLGPSATFGYHPNGQLRLASLGNGTANALLQGSSGLPRPRRIQVVRAGTALFDTGIYRYDGMGNIAEIGTDLYTYDAAGRLLSGTVRHAGAGRREDYRYDGFDNLSGVRRDGSPAWRDLRVDAKNRTVVAGLDDDLRYDGAGNLVYRGRTEVTLTTPHEVMLYDPLNMLTRHTVRQENGTLIREWNYLYGPGNYRVFTLDSETGKRTWMLRDLDGRPLRELGVLGWGPYQGPGDPGERWSFERDFLYAAEGLFATYGAGGVERYFHRDHLGSTRLITGGDGTRVYEAAFYPYGDELQIYGVVGEPASKYTGHERDPIGTTDYMLGRTYGIDLGRFFSIDPARDGWNLYGYVGGNPLSAVDPDGRQPLYLKSHWVAGISTHGSKHTAVVIIPSDQDRYRGDSRFQTAPDSGMVYATVGAGSAKGKLVSGINRDTDADLGTAIDFTPIDSKGMNEESVIDAVFAAEKAYSRGEALDYDLVPESGIMKMGAGDGYNSNSFIRGLIKAVGLEAPDCPDPCVGYGKEAPIPEVVVLSASP